MAVSTTEIAGLETGNTPVDYTVPAALIFDLLSVHGFFDGSAAGGDFLPGIEIISDAGHTISLTVGEKVTAGDSAEVTFGPFLKGATAAAAVATGMPWAYAPTAAGYNAGDYDIGRSPDPLSFGGTGQGTSDATAFAFDTTNSPGAGDGFVQILRSGLYLLRFVVSPAQTLDVNFDPGYNWDIAAQAEGLDAVGSHFFGPDRFSRTSGYMATAWVSYPHPRDNGGAPNGISMLTPSAQDPETTVYLNLLDDSVTWPVAVNCSFRHGLNDADITNPFSYALWAFRVSDAIEVVGSP